MLDSWKEHFQHMHIIKAYSKHQITCIATTYDNFLLLEQLKNIIFTLLLTSISSRSSFFLRRMFDSSSLSSKDRSSGTGKYTELGGKMKEHVCVWEREGGAGLWGWIKLIHLQTSLSESQGLGLTVQHTYSMNPCQRHYSWPKLIH